MFSLRNVPTTIIIHAEKPIFLLHAQTIELDRLLILRKLSQGPPMDDSIYLLFTLMLFLTILK